MSLRGEILPTSLPELPIQLRDLRNNQKTAKPNVLFSKQFEKTPPILPHIVFFAIVCYVLLCFPMLFHPGDPVNTAVLKPDWFISSFQGITLSFWIVLKCIVHKNGLSVNNTVYAQKLIVVKSFWGKTNSNPKFSPSLTDIRSRFTTNRYRNNGAILWPNMVNNEGNCFE